MFGIIYAIIGIVGKIGWHNKQVRENRNSFYRTYNSTRGTYLDMYGIERKPSGEYCRTQRDTLTGDLVQIDKNYKIIRNFSEEKRLVDSKSPKASVIKMSENNIHTHMDTEVFGIRYIDKNNNNEYVIRWFNVEPYGLVRFYMDTTTGYLIRMTDGEIEYKREKDYSIINKFITEFNHKQSVEKKHILEKFYNDSNAMDITEDIYPLY
jgi:hypothetical protein